VEEDSYRQLRLCRFLGNPVAFAVVDRNIGEPLLLFGRMGKLSLTRTTSKSWIWRLSDLALGISYC
jgi:hypothetical protein